MNAFDKILFIKHALFPPVPYDFTSFENIDKIISDYKSHPSILIIRDLVNTGIKFDFDLTTPKDFEKVILMLDCNKGAVPNDIHVKTLRCSSNIISSYLSTIYNVAKNRDFKQSLYEQILQ